MQIAQSKTREEFPLSEKKIIKKTLASITNMLIACFFMLLALIGSIIGIGHVDQINNMDSIMGVIYKFVIGIIVFLLVMIWLNYAYQRWYFAVYFYDLAPDFIRIKKGPITPREITIPYERIQDVYVDQDLLDRIFGLYDVHLSSATATSGMEAHIDGLEKQAAEGLRNALLQIIQQKIKANPNKDNLSGL